MRSSSHSLILVSHGRGTGDGDVYPQGHASDVNRACPLEELGVADSEGILLLLPFLL